MAVIQFKTIKNNASGEHSTTSTISKPGVLSNDDLDLYRSDNRNDRQKFIDQMPNVNPAYDSMSNVGSGIDESRHVYQYLNPYRTCDLIIGSRDSVSLTDPKWGNWRNLEPNNPSTQIVPDNVVLTLEDPKIGFQFTHHVESAFQGLQDKGFLKKVSGALEVARLAVAATGVAVKAENFSTAGKFQSKYAKVPAWKDTSALQIDAALTFKFSFGQFGLFSGEWEVVRPILALAHHFSLRANGNYVRGPAPTPAAYLINLFSQATSSGESGKGSLASRAAANIETAGKGVVSGGLGALMSNEDKAQDGFSVAVSALTTIEKELYETMDTAIETTISDIDTPLNTIAIRVGRLVVGSIIVQDVKWSFDYANLDEYGYPCSGEITLSNLEMIYYPLPWTFMNVFDAGVNQKIQ